MDRLGRSLKQLIETITHLQEQGIGFKRLQENIDTTSPELPLGGARCPGLMNDLGNTVSGHVYDARVLALRIAARSRTVRLSAS